MTISPGDTFDLITVLRLAGRDDRHRKYWECRCECGRVWNVRGDGLRGGRTHSCGKRGCYRAAVSGVKRARHFLSASPEYSVWCGMLYRCENSKAPNYKRYGGRGIKVCERWHSIHNFIADMGPRPSREYSIDRRDNDGNYEPGNCYWATPAQQAKNTSITVKVVLFGETTSVNEAWKRLGLKSQQRLYNYARGNGVSMQAAVNYFATVTQRAAA